MLNSLVKCDDNKCLALIVNFKDFLSLLVKGKEERKPKDKIIFVNRFQIYLNDLEFLCAKLLEFSNNS